MKINIEQYDEICGADDAECRRRVDNALSLHAALEIEAWQEENAEPA